MKKRLVSLLLAFSMMLTFLPVGAVQAFAEDTTAPTLEESDYIDSSTLSNGTLYYDLYSDDTAVLKRWITSTNSGTVSFPRTVTREGKTYTVTTIGDGLKKVILARSGYTFYDWKGTVTLPDTVTKISAGAFSACAITGITIPNSVTEIGNQAFDNCRGLKSITIPESVTKFGDETSDSLFYGCTGLTTAVINAPVKSLLGTFNGCTSLTSVTLPNTVKELKYTFNGCASLASVTLPDSVTTIGDNTFAGCSNLTEITLPSGLETIGTLAFQNSGIESITIPGSVKTIYGEKSFYNNASFTYYGAFQDCKSLTTVTIEGKDGDPQLTIGAEAFSGCTNLKTIYWPKRLSSAGSMVFSGLTKDSAATIYYNGTLADLRNSSINDLNVSVNAPYKAALSYSSYYYVDVLYYCQVSFDPNGGEMNDPTTVNVYYGKTVDSANIAEPTRSGYTFEGWYTAADGGTMFDFETDTVTADMTLYARWKKIPVPATISIAGPDNTTVKAGEASDPFTVTANANDDTGAKAKFTVPDGVKLEYKKADDTWTTVNNGDTMDIADANNKQFRIIHTDDVASDTKVTVSVKLVKADDSDVTGDKASASVDYTVIPREHTTVTIDGLPDNVKQGNSYEFTVKVDPKDDTGKGTLDFGEKNGEIEWKDSDGKWHPMTETPEIDLDNVDENGYQFRITPKDTGDNQTLTATVKQGNKDLGRDSKNYNVATRVNAVIAITPETASVETGTAQEFEIKITANDDTNVPVTAKAGFTGPVDGLEKLEFDRTGNGDWVNVTSQNLELTLSRLQSGTYKLRATFAVAGSYELNASLTKADNTEIKSNSATVTVTAKQNPDPTPNPGGDNNNPGGNTGDNTETDETKNWAAVTVEDGTITKVLDKDGKDITDKVTATKTADETSKTKLTYKAPADATVTVKANDAPEGMKFKMWVFSVASMNSDTNNDIYNSEMTFTVPEKGVTVSAMYESADIDDGPSIIGGIAIGATIVAGGAALTYQTYSLATGFLGDLWGLPYFPSNRSALALMLWQDAGKPMPASELLYPDVGQEEQDMDLQHAARWAMENELIPDKNDKDADLAPEEVKFFPNDAITKYSVLKAWKKAQELKTSQSR